MLISVSVDARDDVVDGLSYLVPKHTEPTATLPSNGCIPHDTHAALRPLGADDEVLPQIVRYSAFPLVVSL